MDVTDYVLGGGALGCGWLAWVIFEGTAFLDVDALWAIPLAIIALILGGLFIHRMAKVAEQRTKKLKDLAEQMGMEFSEKGDNISSSSSGFELFSTNTFLAKSQNHFGSTVPRLPFLGGSGPRVELTNVLHGDSEQLGYGEEFRVTILDCSRSEHSLRTQTTRYTVQTVICFRSPQLSLPDFSMRPEHFFHKIGSVLGYQDIDFESHPTAAEFSKKYLLRGKDEQKIRALFTDTALTFFAAHPDKVCVEGSDDQLIWYQPGKIIEPEDIPGFMKEGFEVFRLFARKQN